MRIADLRLTKEGPWWTASARLLWSDRRRASDTLTYEVAADAGEDFGPSPEGFVLACLPLALLRGEPVVEVEGTLSPRMLSGLRSAMEGYARFDSSLGPTAVEPLGGLREVEPGTGTRALYLSGGVDSLSLLLEKRREYPADHPASVHTGLHLFGLNTHDHDARGRRVPERWRRFEQYLRRLDVFAHSEGLSVVPMRTNVRALYPDFEAWSRGYAMGLGAAAHFFSGRFSEVWLADHGPAQSIRRDQLFWLEECETEAVRTRVGQPGLSRVDKLKALIEWPAAMAVLRPCVYRELPPGGRLNCGRCGKCVRTRLILMALGAGDRIAEPQEPGLRARQIAGLLEEPEQASYLLGLLPEIVEGLRARGEHRLAHAVGRVVKRCRRILARRDAPPEGLRSRLGAFLRRGS